MERTCLDKSALKAMDDYWEYRRIVGDDDEGKLFTPEQYEEYKRKVLPQRAQNRLYVSFGVPGGIDCKLIGPETQCFCTHRYRQHKTDLKWFPLSDPSPCHARSGDVIALPTNMLPGSGHTLSAAGSSCAGFQSPYTCGCGQPSSAHQTLVETKQEREGRGRPVGRDVPYAAMGGLTGFSSLLDGYLALEAYGSDQEREDGCQQRRSVSQIKETSPKTFSSVRCKRETNKQ